MKGLWEIFLTALLLLLPGCGTERRDGPQEYRSDTSSADCCLCGGGIEDLIPAYWGQNNIALVSLNTFEIMPVEINRYDRLTGRLIEEYAGTVSFGGGRSEDGGFSASLLVDCDRGYATGTIDFHNDEALDTAKAAGFLCADCLNALLPRGAEQCRGVAVVDLGTGEIQVLEKSLTGFTLGDFYVDCGWAEREGASGQMSVFVCFCPVRYGGKS